MNMLSLLNKPGIVALVLVGACALRSTAQEEVTNEVYKGQLRGSELKIAGTSTVHDWEVNTKLISGNLLLTQG